MDWVGPSDTQFCEGLKLILDSTGLDWVARNENHLCCD